MYENITFESILERMLEKVPKGMDRREGAIVYDAIAPCAVELLLMYIELDRIIKETFADTASREYLLRRASERGIEPNSATHAILKGEFNCEVEIGVRFSNDSLEYEVIEKIEDFIYKLKCETVGSIGNRFFGEILPIDHVKGLETALLTELLIPGEDEESTESVRDRYFNTFIVNSFGGNVSEYTERVNAIDGVGSTKVLPVWNGGGTVKLVIIDGDFNKANDVLIDYVQELVDPRKDGSGLGLAPIGHIVTVETVEEVVTNIQTKLTFESWSNYEIVNSKINDVLQSYFLTLREGWGDTDNIVVRIAQIESLILGIEGVLDIQDTKLNGEGINSILGSYQIPILGEFTNE